MSDIIREQTPAPTMSEASFNLENSDLLDLDNMPPLFGFTGEDTSPGLSLPRISDSFDAGESTSHGWSKYGPMLAMGAEPVSLHS
jgi:hypothetical protein